MKGTRLFQLRSGKDVQVMEFEDEFNPDADHQLLRHWHAKIILFHKASGHHVIDNTRIPLEDDQVHIVFPGQLHQLNIDYCKGLIILVAEPIFRKVFHLYLTYFLKYQAHGSIQAIQPPNFDHLLQLGWQLKTSLKEEGNPMAKSYLDIILYQVSSNYGKLPLHQTPDDSISYQFLELLYKNYIKEHAVGFYTHQLHTTTRSLYNACMKSFSKPPSEIISDCLLSESMRLLIMGKHQISEIAETLCFSSTSSFSSFIRKKVQKTPSELLQELRKLYD